MHVLDEFLVAERPGRSGDREGERLPADLLAHEPHVGAGEEDRVPEFVEARRDVEAPWIRAEGRRDGPMRLRESPPAQRDRVRSVGEVRRGEERDVADEMEKAGVEQGTVVDVGIGIGSEFVRGDAPGDGDSLPGIRANPPLVRRETLERELLPRRVRCPDVQDRVGAVLDSSPALVDLERREAVLRGCHRKGEPGFENGFRREFDRVRELRRVLELRSASRGGRGGGDAG